MRNILFIFFKYFFSISISLFKLRTGKILLKINGFALLPTQRLVDVLHDGDEVTMSGGVSPSRFTGTPSPVDMASPAKAPRTCQMGLSELGWLRISLKSNPRLTTQYKRKVFNMVFIMFQKGAFYILSGAGSQSSTVLMVCSRIISVRSLAKVRGTMHCWCWDSRYWKLSASLPPSLSWNHLVKQRGECWRCWNSYTPWN